MAATDFRVTPYVQNPATNAMTLIWFSQDNTPGQLRYWPQGGATATVSSAATLAVVVDASAWQHQERLTALQAGTTYHYSVTQGATTYSNSFKTAPSRNSPIRFVYYNDPETEPGSTGSKTTDWDDPVTGKPRSYFIDQTTGFASNLTTIAKRNPDLIVIAGDLAGTGSVQTHWDEFWRHNAGSLNDPAGSIPIMAALGNHDYYSYSQPASENAVGKWLAYFDNPANGAGTAAQQERFYRLDYGPATFIVLDLNNGDDGDLQKDTNYYLTRASGCQAPDFNPGSVQYQWLEAQLAHAQTNSRFTFVVSHQMPFSSGYHGRANSFAVEELLSGVGTRVLTNLLTRYGVDAWLCGHDEMMEHSQVTGREIGPGGAWTNTYTLHIFDNASAGDGLRGTARAENPWETFRAHVDAPEMYDSRNILTNGGKHYGHMEVNIAPNSNGEWAATLTPVYVFVTTNTSGQAVGFDRRTYNDEVILTNRQEVTATTPTPTIFLLTSFAPLVTAIPATPPLNVWTDTVSTTHSTCFYRIGVGQ